jgi:hypothetical protein
MHPPSDPFLADLYAAAESTAEQYDRLAQRFSPQQLAWKPSAEAWSMAECAEHVLRTERAYGKRVQACIAEAPKADPDAGRYRARWIMRKAFYPFVSPDSARKMKTFAPVEPVEAGDSSAAERIVRETAQHHRGLLPLIAEAEGVDLRRARMTSPLFSLAKYQLGEALEILVLHAQRHLQQAERVAEAPGFPRGGAQS